MNLDEITRISDLNTVRWNIEALKKLPASTGLGISRNKQLKRAGIIQREGLQYKLTPYGVELLREVEAE